MIKRKIAGIALAIIGIAFARADVFFHMEKMQAFSLNAAGILIAFMGLALYAAGMPSTRKKFKACPECFTKNEAGADNCKKCRTPLSQPGQP